MFPACYKVINRTSCPGAHSCKSDCTHWFKTPSCVPPPFLKQKIWWTCHLSDKNLSFFWEITRFCFLLMWKFLPIQFDVFYHDRMSCEVRLLLKCFLLCDEVISSEVLLISVAKVYHVVIWFFWGPEQIHLMYTWIFFKNEGWVHGEHVETSAICRFSGDCWFRWELFLQLFIYSSCRYWC